MTKFSQEIFEIKEPIKVFCVPAESFPEGVGSAYQKLYKLAPADPNRKYYGISWGGPSITYKAAATEVTQDELKDKGLEEFTIRSGKYLAVTTRDSSQMKDIFSELINDPRLDQKGYCVEIHHNDGSIKCMVTLREK